MGTIENADLTLQTTAKDEASNTHYAATDDAVTLVDTCLLYTSLWIEMTGYDTEENKKNRQIICTILKEELKLVEKEELEEE